MKACSPVHARMNTPGRWARLITEAMIAHGLNLQDNDDVARFVHLRPLWLQSETY